MPTSYSGDRRGKVTCWAPPGSWAVFFFLSAGILSAFSLPAWAAEPAFLYIPSPPKRDEVERFKTLVGVKNIGEFELNWRKYIDALYEREFHKDGPRGLAPNAPFAFEGQEALDWPFDRLYLHAGNKEPRVVMGLIRGEDPSEIDFFEIRRIPGRRLSMEGLPVKPGDVVRREELSAESRVRLCQLIQQYMNRDSIAQLNKKELRLGKRTDDFKRQLKTYRGAGFELESTAEEETVLDSVVRIDQRMKAYRRLMPPTTAAPRQPLRILLLGSALEYKTYLAQNRTDVAGPAFYLPKTNQVVAYTERDIVLKKFEQALGNNNGLMQMLAKKTADQQRHLKQEAEEYQKAGANADEIRKASRLLQAEFNREIAQIKQAIEESKRKNQQALDEYVEQTYRVLYHEIFHAYLESYVFSQKEVPRWLNEGLAQIMENGRLESGQLRIDAPDRGRLKRLYDDLHGPDPLTLVGLLQAPPEAFLGIHESQASKVVEADRYYLYSWGLAYYLAFEKRASLGTKALDAYVSPLGAPPNAIPARPAPVPSEVGRVED